MDAAESNGEHGVACPQSPHFVTHLGRTSLASCVKSGTDSWAQDWPVECEY